MRDYIKTMIKGLLLIYLLYSIPVGKILYAQKNNQKINESIPVNFNSNGSNVKGWFFPAKGTGLIPTMILLHGFPGGEGDQFGLGQKMMNKSINVLTFNHPEIKRVISIAGTDHGEITREYLRNESFAKMINDMFDSFRTPEGPIQRDGKFAAGLNSNLII